MTNRAKLAAFAYAVSGVVGVSGVMGADLFWQGGSGAVNSANYYKPSTLETNVAPPATGDFDYVGADGTVSVVDTQDITLARLRIGHNFTAGEPLGPAGAGTMNITGGKLTLAGTKETSPDSPGSAGALIIGYNQSGAVNVSGGTLQMGRYLSVGLDNANDAIDNAPGATATLTISGTGTVSVTHATNLSSTVYVANGVPGSLTISDSGTLKTTSADLQVGVLNPGTFTQTGGTTSISGAIAVGLNTVTGSNMSVSGGTMSTGGGLQIAGSGSSNTIGTSATFSGTAAVTVANALTVGANGSTGTTLTISDNADVKVGTGTNTNNIFIGRGTSDNTTFNMTGGSLSATKYFLMGTGNQPSGDTDPHHVSKPTNIVGNQSGGTITTGDNFVLADAGGQSTYNLSGGAINAGTRMYVGRQQATAVMNQTGGSVTAGNGVHIGDAAGNSDATLWGTGVYNLSGGSISATVPEASTADALSIATQGTGTLKVIGSDAGVSVTGNMLVNNTPATDTLPAFVGTLAYQLQAGESLTEINVSGTATFATGSVLSLDLNGVTPAASSYDVLTAADIIDNGLSFAAPAGWDYRIVSGGNGELLQLFAAVTRITGDTNGDGVVDLSDLNNVLNNFGSTAPGNAGDDNRDNVVDLQDLNNVLNNFGSHAAAGALAAVPEPASVGLLGMGVAAIASRRRRRA